MHAFGCICLQDTQFKMSRHAASKDTVIPRSNTARSGDIPQHECPCSGWVKSKKMGWVWPCWIYSPQSTHQRAVVVRLLVCDPQDTRLFELMTTLRWRLAKESVSWSPDLHIFNPDSRWEKVSVYLSATDKSIAWNFSELTSSASCKSILAAKQSLPSPNHSEGSDRSIYHSWSFYDREYFLPLTLFPNPFSAETPGQNACFILQKFMSRPGNCKEKLSAAFHAYA